MKILLVGAGNMGSKYLNVLEKLGLKPAICDLDPNKRKEGYEFYCEIGEINKPFDKAIIATNPAFHVKLSKKLKEAGMSILIEKPPALSYEDLNSLSIYKDIWVSEIERFSICIKEFPKHEDIDYIEIRRLNTRKGYINPFWDLAWHDMYNLLYLFKDVEIDDINTDTWELKGYINSPKKEKIRFDIRVSWENDLVSRYWKLKTKKGHYFLNFADEEVLYPDGSSFRRQDGDKLTEMISAFLNNDYDGSFERALKILKIFENIPNT